mmetsp:Transcript_35663/g.93677  ORF Transcript_35663/g.93677 Transcript_35663/m.93677 type:complete len:88 (+) Transcript_35663:158-421(+)
MAARAAEAERVALERLPAAFALPAGGGGSAATTKVIMREFVRLSALQEAGRAEGLAVQLADEDNGTSLCRRHPCPSRRPCLRSRLAH